MRTTADVEQWLVLRFANGLQVQVAIVRSANPVEGSDDE